MSVQDGHFFLKSKNNSYYCLFDILRYNYTRSNRIAAVVLHQSLQILFVKGVHIKMNDVILLLTFVIVLTEVRAIINDIKKK